MLQKFSDRILFIKHQKEEKKFPCSIDVTNHFVKGLFNDNTVCVVKRTDFNLCRWTFTACAFPNC